MRLEYWLSIVGASSLWLSVGCGDDARVSNDPAPFVDMGGTGGATSDGGQGTAVGEPVDQHDGGGTTGPVSMVSIAGTGTACNSYTAQTASTCGSYYCGVDMATLTAATTPGAKCSSNPSYLCKATLPRVVGACARKIKSAKPLRSTKQLRPEVHDCAYQDPEVKAEVSDECLDCYLDSAECAGTHCVFACLSGDSPSCDACLLKNNCSQPVFACAGLPNPL